GVAICGGGMNSDNEIGSAITGGDISNAFSNSAKGETDSACTNSKGGAESPKGGGEGLRFVRVLFFSSATSRAAIIAASSSSATSTTTDALASATEASSVRLPASVAVSVNTA